jgi:hypothetical protein
MMTPLQQIEADEQRWQQLKAENDEMVKRAQAGWHKFLEDWHKPSVVQFERGQDEGLL